MYCCLTIEGGGIGNGFGWPPSPNCFLIIICLTEFKSTFSTLLNINGTWNDFFISSWKDIPPPLVSTLLILSVITFSFGYIILDSLRSILPFSNISARSFWIIVCCWGKISEWKIGLVLAKRWLLPKSIVILKSSDGPDGLIWIWLLCRSKLVWYWFNYLRICSHSNLI